MRPSLATAAVKRTKLAAGTTPESESRSGENRRVDSRRKPPGTIACQGPLPGIAGNQWLDVRVRGVDFERVKALQYFLPVRMPATRVVSG